MVAMEKISQAHDNLLEALDMADRIKEQGIDSARENIAKLGLMSARMQQKVANLPRPAGSETMSDEHN